MATQFGKAFVEVKADVTAFPAELRTKLKAALEEGAAVVGDGHGPLDTAMHKAGEGAAQALGDGVDKGSRRSMLQAGRNAAERFSYGFSAFVGRVLFSKASMWTMLISTAGSAIAALMPAVYALAGAAPAALGGLVAGAVAVTLAFHGMGTAISGALSGKLDPAALAALAPAARAFVSEIAALRPALKGLQQDVQQAFFVQLEGSLTRVATNLLPTVRAGMTALSSQIGGVARGVLDVMASATAKSATATFFAQFAAGMKALAPAVAATARAMFQLTAGASPFLRQMSEAVARMLTNFSNFIDRASNSGALTSFFSTGYAVLSNFAHLLGEVGRLLGGLLSGLGAGGGQFLGTLSAIVGVLADLFNSPGGQQLLATLTQLSTVLGNLLVQVLLPLLPAVAQLATALGGDLVSAIEAITPYAAELATSLVPVLQWLADHHDLAAGILGVAAALKAAAIAWGIAQAAEEAATAAMIAFDVAADANPIGAIVLAIEAIVAGIILLVMNWKDVKKYGSEAWGAIKDAASAVWDWVKNAAGNVSAWFGEVVAWFQALPGRIGDFLISIPGRIEDAFRTAFLLAVRAVGFGVGMIIGGVIELPGRIVQGLSALGSLLSDLWSTAWAWLTTTAAQKADELVNWVFALPGRLVAGVRALPGLLKDAFHTAFEWAVNAARSGGQKVIDFAMSLPGRLGGFMRNVGHDILSGLKGGINAVIDSFNRGIDDASHYLHIGLPHIPRLARGAVINNPTLALVGEAGREVVLPVDDPTRALELLQQSGLMAALRGNMSAVSAGQAPAPNVKVTAILSTGELITVVRTVVDQELDAEAKALGAVRG